MNPSPKQVAMAEEIVQKHLCYPLDEEITKPYLMGSLRAKDVIQVLATAISNAVEDARIGWVSHATMCSQINASVNAEREACAEVAESLENQAQLIHDASVFNYIDVAKAIRTRGSKKKVK